MQNKKVQQVIALLEQARKRPGMYFPLDNNGNGFMGFIGGIQSMRVIFFGSENDPDLTNTVLQERGWESKNGIALWIEMRDRGFDVHKIIDETLIIEIEIMRRYYNL